MGNHICGTAIAALSLIGLVTSTGAAAIPDVIVQGNQHRYVVWLDPNLEDDTAAPPLTDADMARYCSVADSFARKMWQLTNGLHQVVQVEFVYDVNPPTAYQVLWQRNDGRAYASSVGLGTTVYVYDDHVWATHTWTEQSVPGSQWELCDPSISVCKQDNCPPGFHIEDLAADSHVCVDDAGNHALATADYEGWVLSHEVSHSFYNIGDEYIYPNDNFLVLDGMGICANPTDWHTSVMATKTEFWCDENTHLTERFVGAGIDSPFAGNITVTNPAPDAAWTSAKAKWPDLASYSPGAPVAHVPGSTPTNDYFVNPAPPWQPLDPNTFCTFTGGDLPNALLNDVVVVVDKSGSMGYRNTPLDVTAFEAAFAAGLGHFNRTTAQRMSGLTVFDSSVSRLIPYQPGNAPQPISNFALAAGGLTNLCEAISDTAAQIRASASTDSIGHMILLTDGRPTVPGCSTAEEVRSAAYAACVPGEYGGKTVVISTIAYGDADYALIADIAEICGGEARQTDGSDCPAGTTCSAASVISSTPPGYPTPLSIKAAATRLGYHTRGFKEAVSVKELLPPLLERSFDIPPGTQELEVAWMGEQTEYTPFTPPKIVIGDPPATDNTLCEFQDDYFFELVDPDGNLAGVDVVTPEFELDYLTRTQRVARPQAGRWTMRMGGGEPCVVGGEQPPPEVAMIASYRHGRVRAEVNLEKPSVALNESTRVTAFLVTGTDTSATNIQVTAKLVNGDTNLAIPMWDDGMQGGDQRAGDGLYSGIINPNCSATYLGAGAYRLLVELQSDAGSALPVILPNPDVQTAYGHGATPPGGAISASLLEEEMLTVRDCESTNPGCAGASPGTNLCLSESAYVDGDIEIVAGETTPDITVTVMNCPIASEGVSVGIGPGVTTSNVRVEYDDALGMGTVTFDATARSSAPSGERQVSISWGRHRCDTTGVVIPVYGCNPLPDYDGDGIGDECDDNSLVADAGPDQTVECTSDGQAWVTLDGTGSGAPIGDIDYLWTATAPLESVDEVVVEGSFELGMAEVTLTVSQGDASQSNSALITVVDTIAPILTVPPDVLATTCTLVTIGQATAVDGCGGPVSITNDAPGSFRAGVTLVTWTATDSYGNSTAKTQKIAVGLGDSPSCCPLGSTIKLGTSNNDTIVGTAGADCIISYGAQDTIYGLGGNDTINAGDGDDVVEAGAGNDWVFGGSGQDQINGGTGADFINGGDGDDTCRGGDQDDVIYGGQGQDKLYGDNGNDQMFGDDGDDRLEGGAGNDTLTGGGLHDTCIGGLGTDVFFTCQTATQ